MKTRTVSTRTVSTRTVSTRTVTLLVVVSVLSTAVLAVLCTTLWYMSQRQRFLRAVTYATWGSVAPQRTMRPHHSLRIPKGALRISKERQDVLRFCKAHLQTLRPPFTSKDLGTLVMMLTMHAWYGDVLLLPLTLTLLYMSPGKRMAIF